VWVDRSAPHKSQQPGRERFIFAGPKAQDVLGHYLLRGKEAIHCTPAERDLAKAANVAAKIG
jgi:hypothetical protein